MSPLVFYAGSGSRANANSNAFTAYQSAIWDRTNNPEVVTSSFSFGATPQQGQFIGAQPSPSSPFFFAEQQLFLDAALRNMSLFSSAGDRGSGDGFGNGLTNIARESPYNVLVGGTSLSPLSAAAADPTLFNIVAMAAANDPSTIWQLISGGLTTLPSASASGVTLVETVWNNYQVSGSTITDTKGRGYFLQNTGAGGADPSVNVPHYQTEFGLAPTTADPAQLPGRGLPDVSANGGGNMLYTVPTGDLTSTINEYGTSASTPLWASLAVQINAVFHDQGLPALGYMNDVLYIAAAIAPASFNDITIGNNTSSYAYGSAYTTDNTAVTPTGFGYQARPGYDLATGLGSPNGLLLTRALTVIAHSQTSFSGEPNVVNPDNHGSWLSGADQTLLVQAMSPNSVNVGVTQGPNTFSFSSAPSWLFAWTSRMAQQVLQPDFDSRLVLMFDGQSQGALTQTSVHAGERLAISLNGASAEAMQATLTSAFGFADFFASGGNERVARPVAIAETAGGANDQTTIVRVRQDAPDSLSVTFYRVDDLNGSVAGIHPGDPGYEALLQARAYHLTSGGTSLAGPGYGNYAQAGLAHVNAGDLMAMRLTNHTTGFMYSGFSQANEVVNGQPVGHLWSYGLNTWGFEDAYGGGDRDFNDLVIGIDFTSHSGQGWLM